MSDPSEECSPSSSSCAIKTENTNESSDGSINEATDLIKPEITEHSRTCDDLPCDEKADDGNCNESYNENVTDPSIDEDEEPIKVPRRRGRKRGVIYNRDEDPDTIKEKKKKRAVELKLKNLKWTLNQSSEVSGKREKKVPQRFELSPVNKRKSSVDNYQGNGTCLGDIGWICQQLRNASLYTLRLLHRTIYRKQGMFSEKHIRKSVMKFSGFPFGPDDPEIARRKEQLEKSSPKALYGLCDLLGMKCGTKEEMVDDIINFLMSPSLEQVEKFLQDFMYEKMQQSRNQQVTRIPEFTIQEAISPEDGINQDDMQRYTLGIPSADVMSSPWKKPVFFAEGNGVKLKYIRAVTSNIQSASDAFIELLHRLLYLNVDEKLNMRRNILEFSGLKCDVGTNNYTYRTRILGVLPVEQIKLICRVLCLPTWHRSRQLLTEGIMDFLSAPRISAMKKRVPPHFSDEITFSFDGNQKIQLPELKSVETEEIEIIPDIHLPDEPSNLVESEFALENEYLGVKLKNFSNIHYQVISTPAAKLHDVHMILYLKRCAPNNIRKSVLEFSGFTFDECSSEYQCRRSLMEQMSLEDLKTVATVLCVSQYIVDKAKQSLVEAILKFLLKPSALLNCSTIMPTITPLPKPPPIKKPPDVKCHEAKLKRFPNHMEITVKPITATSSPPKTEVKPEIEIIPTSSSSSMEVRRVSKDEADEPLSKVKSAVKPVCVPVFTSDDEEDQPLSKLVGHPNDDQLRLLIGKIIKESQLEDITMKHVIRKVAETYPNFDLGYRKEFIKSTVRLILSQMDDQNCSVSTTVITI